MKYYIIAGEASGDLHGSNLMKALLKEDANAEFRFWGGDLMQAVGGTLVTHYKERAFMGFIEVIMNLRKISKFITFAKKILQDYNQMLLFLLIILALIYALQNGQKQQGFKTIIIFHHKFGHLEQVRVKDIKRDVDAMYVILPFVEDFYKKHDYKVHFVGHPLIDAIANRDQVERIKFRETYQLSDKPIIALITRKQKTRNYKNAYQLCLVLLTILKTINL